MRLTSLARKINKTPSQLITFLGENGLELPNGLHTRLDDSTVKMVVNHFIPGKEVDIQNETVPETNEDINEILNPEIEESADIPRSTNSSDEGTTENQENKVEIQIKPQEIITGTVDDLESDQAENIELIRPKKIKLEGIKVVGKIDLPEKPKKEDKKSEAATVQDEPVDDKLEKPEKRSIPKTRKFDKHRKRPKQGRNRKPLTYEEKLKEEEREKLKKRRQKEREDKRRKKQYYIQNIQPKTVTPSKKKKKKKLQSSATTQKKIVVHKNPLKRLWAWLNGQYDRY